jgi:hypothetical protein
MDFATLVNFIGAFSKKGSDVASTLDGATDIIRQTQTRNSRSIKFRAKDLVAQYPVLYSDNLSLKTVQLIGKALEHEYVHLLRLLVLNNGDADYKDTETYLRGFHQNIYNNANLDPTLLQSPVSEALIAEASKELLTPINEDLNTNVLNNDTVLKEHRALLEADGDEERQYDSRATRKIQGVGDANISTIEIKKANDLSPTNVNVDIVYTPKVLDPATKKYVASTTPVSKTISFGVKCVAHLIDSRDIERYLPNSVITKTPIMRLIQFTTGEIKFFKDFLLAIDEMKDLAIKSNDRNTFWWEKLQTLAKTSKMTPWLNKMKGANKVNQPIPITTMVISKENVDNIKHMHGIDIINKPGFANKIMKNFFLMTFVVVDESIETAYIYNDETRDFSTYSSKQLEGYSKSNNVDMKDLYKALLMK